jgi:hypothetical protein
VSRIAPESGPGRRGWARTRVLTGGVGLLLLALVGTALVKTSAPSDAFAPHRALRVPVAIASDCSRDVTTALSAFVAGVPDHSTIQFSAHGCYRVDGTLELVGRNGLVVDGQDATVRATTTGKRSRSHLRILGGSDVTIRNMRIVGRNTQGGTAHAFVPELQHQMGIDLRGVRGVRVEGVTVSYVYGDCVYVGAGDDDAAWTTDVEVRSSTCVAPGRSGMSVTAGRRITLTGNSILRPGLWGVDIEPNGGATGAVGVTISRNLFTLGPRSLPFVQAVGNSGGGTVSGISVLGNTVRRGSMTTQFVPAPGQRWSGITVSGNKSDTADTRSGTVVTVENVDGIAVVNNHQPGSGGNGVFLYASRTCGVQHAGNTFPGGGQLAVIVPYACGNR